MRVEKLMISKYFKVYPEGKEINYDLLLGYKKQKGKDFILVEKNFVNDYLFNQLEEKPEPDLQLKFNEGLEEYQKRDVLKMITHPEFFNFNPMGYGKTVETVAALKELQIKDAIIIAPKTVLEHWKDECQKWYTDDVIIVENYKDIKYDRINILNYEKLLKAQMMTKLKSHVWSALIIDEAHYIKKVGRKRTDAVKDLPAKIKWGLTGTPITKYPNDMFSLLQFIDPYYCGNSETRFKEYFCKIERGFFSDKIVGLTDDPIKLNIYRKLLDTISLRNLPLGNTVGKKVEKIKLKLNREQRKLYNNVKDLVFKELNESITIPNGAVKCLRLQQATSCPQSLHVQIPGVKFEYIKDTALNNPEEKIVVFTKFLNTVKHLEEYLELHGIKCVTFDGSLSTSEKIQNHKLFINEKSIQVIIGTIAAMGTGVDGLQKVSRLMIMMESDPLPAVNQQCEGRLDRTGQKRQVIIQYIECMGTYDLLVSRSANLRLRDIKRLLDNEDFDT